METETQTRRSTQYVCSATVLGGHSHLQGSGCAQSPSHTQGLDHLMYLSVSIKADWFYNLGKRDKKCWPSSWQLSRSGPEDQGRVRAGKTTL